MQFSFCHSDVAYKINILKGGIVQTLIDRFKDMRQDRKRTVKSDPSDKEATIKKMTRKAPGPYAIPDVPAGEDEISFERHNHVLQSEWAKSSRNAVVIEQLMECTFAMRRRDILDHSFTDVSTRYPFLQEANQVSVLQCM